jgi:hypothetical protein
MSQSKSNNSKSEVVPKNLSKKGRTKESIWRYFDKEIEEDEDIPPFWKEIEETNEDK